MFEGVKTTSIVLACGGKLLHSLLHHIQHGRHTHLLVMFAPHLIRVTFVWFLELYLLAEGFGL